MSKRGLRGSVWVQLGVLANTAVSEEENTKDGYLIDYIFGKPVKDGPEEREAVQAFARMLVEDYGDSHR